MVRLLGKYDQTQRSDRSCNWGAYLGNWLLRLLVSAGVVSEQPGARRPCDLGAHCEAAAEAWHVFPSGLTPLALRRAGEHKESQKLTWRGRRRQWDVTWRCQKTLSMVWWGLLPREQSRRSTWRSFVCSGGDLNYGDWALPVAVGWQLDDLPCASGSHLCVCSGLMMVVWCVIRCWRTHLASPSLQARQEQVALGLSWGWCMVMFTLELPSLLQSEELSLAGKEMFPHTQARPGLLMRSSRPKTMHNSIESQVLFKWHSKSSV